MAQDGQEQQATEDRLDDQLDEGADLRAQERREALAAGWEVIKRLPAYTRLSAALVRDSRVPHRSRAILLAGGAYMVSPIDLVPGIIPVAGQLDDLYVVLTAIRQALRQLPTDVAEDYLDRYQLDTGIVDSDLAAIRRLVRVGVRDGARWSWKRIDQLGSRVGDFLARRRRG